jgi:hypothetical protein
MESLNQALIECVKACGGSAIVGPKLWPEKTRDAAQRLLLDCLNEDRPAHLTPEHMAFLFKLARERGNHEAIGYFLASLGYAAPVPIEPRDEAADLMRQIAESQQVLMTQFQRLTVLQPHLKAVA